MKHVLLIFIVLLIILVSVYYLMKQRQAKEGFASNIVNVEACNNLKYDKLSKSKNVHLSDRVLSNKRVKVYKDAFHTPNLCYINNDIVSGISDNFMGDKACDRNDPYWKKQIESGLIKNVYESTKNINPRFDSLNRCVFELDTDNMNVDKENKLNTFWSGWGDDQLCTRITSNLETRNTELTRVLNEVNSEYASNTAIIKSLLTSNHIIVNESTESNNFISYINSFETDVKNLDKLITDCNIKYKQAETNFINTRNKYINNVNVIESNIRGSNLEIGKQIEERDKLKDKKKLLDDRLIEVGSNITQLLNDIKTGQSNYSEYMTNKVKKIGTNRDLQKNILATNTSIDDMNGVLSDKNTIFKDNKETFDSENGSNNLLINKINELEPEIQTLINRQKDCSDKTASLQREKNILLNTIKNNKERYNQRVEEFNELDTQLQVSREKFKKLQKDYPYLSCNEFTGATDVARHSLNECNKETSTIINAIGVVEKKLDKVNNEALSCDNLQDERRQRPFLIKNHLNKVTSCTTPNCEAHCRTIKTIDNTVLSREGSSMGHNKDYKSCMCMYYGSQTDKIKSQVSNAKIANDILDEIKRSKGMPKRIDKNNAGITVSSYERAGKGLGISIIYKHRNDGIKQIKFEDPEPCKGTDTLEVDFATCQAKCIHKGC